MPQSPLRLVKRVAEFKQRDEVNLLLGNGQEPPKNLADLHNQITTRR